VANPYGLKAPLNPQLYGAKAPVQLTFSAANSNKIHGLESPRPEYSLSMVNDCFRVKLEKKK
jgi:hypothetical protein